MHSIPRNREKCANSSIDNCIEETLLKIKFIRTFFSVCLSLSLSLSLGLVARPPTDPPAFWRFMFGMVLVALTSTAFGLMIASTTRSAMTALAVSPIVLTPLLIFGGFFIASQSIPVWLQWLQYVSLFYWAYRAQSVSQYVGLQLTCTAAELVPPDVGACPFTTGEQVLAASGIDAADIVFYWAMLLTLWLSFWALGLVFFLLTTRVRSIAAVRVGERERDALPESPSAWRASAHSSTVAAAAAVSAKRARQLELADASRSVARALRSHAVAVNDAGYGGG